jgi:Ni/Fe-hydrogenase 1 B-type cytochrome subunit
MSISEGSIFHRVYVWDRPVRTFHWVNAICIVVLIVTGFLIGTPMTPWHAEEAYQQYWFGTVRFAHFVAALVVLFAALARFYWAFVGNRYARWDNFVPVSRHRWKEIVEVLRVDVLQTKAHGIHSIGHNALAGLIYLISFAVFFFQVATGFALYSSMSGLWFPQLFAWVVPLMGGDAVVRHWHHVAMWFFIVFTMIHVYLVIYHDSVEGRGATSAMVGGWKFAKEQAIHRERSQRK